MSRDSSIFLSIIIPAYNEEARLPETLEQVAQFIKAQTFTSEVLIIENGSLDRTWQVAQEFANQHSQFCVIREAQRGKGLAVKTGMLQARGEFRFMCDADLSMPIEELSKFLPPAQTRFDIAIASREAAGSVRYHEPLHRHLGGRVINTIIRWALLPGLQDTQCGFKCFQASTAEDLFRSQSMTGWSFDIELLYIARRRGYRILEIPINWYYNPESKLNIFRDALKMMADIWKIRQNGRKGLYNPRS